MPPVDFEAVPGARFDPDESTGDMNNVTQLPQVSASASRDDAGAIHVSLCNLHFADAAEVTLALPGASIKEVSGKVLTGKEMNSHNTFDKPKTVRPVEFKDAQIKKRDVVVRMPARSVVVLKLT